MNPGDASGRFTSEVLREAFRWLFRTLRTLRTYPLDNEITRHALTELTPRLMQVLPVVLDLTGDHLSTEGEILLDDRGSTPQIVTDLYRDGIRRIRLEVGLSEEELRRLLLVLASPLDPEDVTEDYVTRLWEAELRHVRVAAIDPYLDVEISEDVLEGREQPAPLETEPEADLESGTDEAAQLPAEDAFEIAVSEQTRVLEEVRQTSSAQSWEAFAEAIFDALNTSLGEQRDLEVMGILEAYVHHLVRELKLAVATRVLERLISWSASRADNLFAPARRRMADPERLARLHEAVERGHCKPEEAVSLLVAFGADALPAICSFLERATSDRSRRAYVEALTRIGEPAVPMVVAGFRDGQEPVRRWYARALGGLGGEIVVSTLLDGLAASDPAVRREVVRALSGRDDARAVDALIRSSVDDPEPTTRIVALRGIAGSGTRRSCAELVSRIESREYASLSAEERDLLFRSIGALGDAAALPVLRRILRPRWIRGLERRDDWARAAAAVARLGTPEALEALRALSGERRRELATICGDALRTIGHQPV
jgi:hypothetical protein